MTPRLNSIKLANTEKEIQFDRKIGTMFTAI